MKLGLITLWLKKPLKESILLAKELGLQGVQVYVAEGEMGEFPLSKETIEDYKNFLKENDMEISAFCADMGGYGFERAEDNAERIKKTNYITDLAVEMGVKYLTTHIGVIPEDKNNPTYKVMLDALTTCGLYAKERGITLAIETGPEFASTLLAFLKDTKGGVGVNLDPANFVMVSGQDPVEAVYMLKDYIVHTHLKDGVKLLDNDPTEVYHAFAKGGVDALNACAGFKEMPVGQGSVDWDNYIKALKEIGYDGFLTIEREAVPDPLQDIKNAVTFIKTKI